ncbi:polyprenyl synthetase family protein [Streptococcus sp. 121]|uniref:polyprenyl synthetase family protein n=1 Tax=Streptococcus sp. 121 TaxID=2797637 RepID=UPI0018F05EAB|nr:farnesyl diphosphate synthase [Streptococcus sp. 121]MBJ6746112.1 polyprenyl synthetase family protein [Streptococcus sp. 121]
MKQQTQALEDVLQAFYQSDSPDPVLVESILYSIEAGGKRLRPLILLDLLQGFGLKIEEGHLKVAAALEMIHTGSLIHDDLPAMDDDDYRRGQLTNHKKYGEAAAILAGDSLFLDAFALLAQAQLPAPKVVKLTNLLSLASGTYGMVGGQSLDIRSEGQAITLVQLEQIHHHKTGRLLHFPFVAAGILADVDEQTAEDLDQLGQLLGLAFQVRDDILDETASFEELGKTPKKDVAAQKATYPAFYGLDAAKTLLRDLLAQIDRLLQKLEEQGFDAQIMKERIEGLAIGN